MSPAPHLVLVGPMGAGKSALGRRLAQRCGVPFLDLDREIEARAGADIPTLFARDGEAAFRRLERETLADVLDGPACVLATGGGAVLDAGSRARMRERGYVVHLRIEVEQQLARLANDHKRPLIAGDDREAVLRRLAAERTPLYAEVADLVFPTGGTDPADETAARLAQALRGLWPPGTGTPSPPSDGAGMSASDLQVVHIGGPHPYAIAIGEGLLDDGNALTSRLRGRHALIVSDDHVSPLYARRVEVALHNMRPDLILSRFVMPPGEQAKTLANFAEAIDALARLGATRDACVLALGGGVVGDLAGFAAACWMRGIDCIQLPTTLLAMVDSSVGGKTAVDLPHGKNLVGAFHPPRAVFADIAALDTLPDRELRAGLAEVVKYGAIADVPFLDWLEANAAALLARDRAALTEAIARSCRHKADIVERDLYEHGDRALLNFGHTFAHAIETEQGYSGVGSDALNHGEAVAVGMVLAARLSAHLGMAPAADAVRLRGLLDAFGLPTTLPDGLAPDRLIARMRLDKKAHAAGLRFILWEGAGVARIVDDVPEGALADVLLGD